MGAAIPGSKPQQSLFDTAKILEKENIPEAVKLLFVRGYYKRTMGDPTKNDRRIYDDAVFVVSPDCYVSFNCNVDPNGVRPGHGKGSSKGMASLKFGLYRAHKIGLHKGQYIALVQTAGKVTVYRDADSSVPQDQTTYLDGQRVYEETGMFGINIHRGGVSGTSSLGCLTIPTAQYPAFIALVQAQLKKYGQKVMPVLIVEGA